MEEVEIFEEFVVMEDNKENPCACARVWNDWLVQRSNFEKITRTWKMCLWNCADRIWEKQAWKAKTKQRKNEQQSTMEEVEIFEEFVVLEDNKENPSACS